MQIVLSDDYGYVLASLFLTFITNFVLTYLVIWARKKYHVKYPLLYATGSTPDAIAFNCTQRAHQNTLESWAPFCITLLLVGLWYPIFAAVCGLLWSIGRLIYGFGYSFGGPSGRTPGAIFSHLGDIPLLCALGYIAFQTVMVAWKRN